MAEPGEVYIPKTTRAKANTGGKKRRRVATDGDFYAMVWGRELSSGDEEARGAQFCTSVIQYEPCPNLDASLSDIDFEEGGEYVGIILRWIRIS